MFMFYVDETGNRSPIKPGAAAVDEQWLYVLTAVSLYEHHWHGFEKTLNRAKGELIHRIQERGGASLELADCEVKSNWVRIAGERQKRPFLSGLMPDELTGLIQQYYDQLSHHCMHILSVLVDKRCLSSSTSQIELHKLSWELLLKRIENLMQANYPKHQALIVVDDTSKQANRSLAMQHAKLLDKGTHDGQWLKHICEMPMFVRSELSNGVQLADLCSYNIYRAFRDNDLKYPFFNRIESQIWSRRNPVKYPFYGLLTHPATSALCDLVESWETRTIKRPAPADSTEAGED
ncbi:MAG: DUF3800 domain-containing protein [Phycisphaerae bacterium]